MKHKKEYIFLTCFCLLCLLPFFLSEAKFGHDIGFHLKNIELFSKYLSWDFLKQGFLILPDTANNLGYGIGIFYPGLPHLLGAVIYKITSLFTSDVIVSVYVLYFFIVTFSSFILYQLGMKLHNNTKIAVLCSCIYITMPYVFGNLFVRGALNEIFILLFMPMLILGLLCLFDNEVKKFYFYFVIGVTGMVFSHLVMTLYAFFLMIPFVIIYFKKIIQEKYLKHLIIASILILIIVLPNLILLLEHYLSGHYLVSSVGYLTSQTLVQSETLKLSDLLFPKGNYDWEVVKYISFIPLISFLISYFFYFLKRKEKRQPLILFLGIFTVLILMFMSPWFPYQHLPNIFYMIQFPWRLESFLILAIALISPYWILKIKNVKKQDLIISIAMFLIVVTTIPLMNSLLERKYDLKRYYSNEDTLAMGHSNEYLPVLASDNWKDRTSSILIKNGEGKIAILKNGPFLFSFRLIEESNELEIELPKLYYQGYRLTDSQGITYPLFQSENGYLSSKIDKIGTYTLEYVGTSKFQIARKIRLFGIVLFTVYGIYSLLKQRKL